MAQWPIEYKHQKTDHQLAISKHLDGTPYGWLLLDKLRQALQGIQDGKALSLIVGVSRTVVLSSPDEFCSIHVQNHKSFLGTTIKLHMHHISWDKACLKWQTHLA